MRLLIAFFLLSLCLNFANAQSDKQGIVVKDSSAYKSVDTSILSVIIISRTETNIMIELRNYSNMSEDQIYDLVKYFFRPKRNTKNL